jgi:Fic family protein
MNRLDLEPINSYNRLMKYNWQQNDWPNFHYNLELVQDTLFKIARKTGYIAGKHSDLPSDTQTEILINLMVEEAVKTSKIEGEYISHIDIRLSIRKKLGLLGPPTKVHDKRADGVAELMVSVRKTFKEPLSEEMLLDWHLNLLGANPNPHIFVGRWRESEEPMQVVLGRGDKWIVHFEAPPSRIVPQEMERYIAWFNQSATHPSATMMAPIHAAIAHLYFDSIHPFDDGNGRIGRALAEKALYQAFDCPLLLSLSSTIEGNKKAYYAALQTASQSNDISSWIQYFLNTIFEAQCNAENEINFIIRKAKFFDTYKEKFNERQMKAVKKMMDAGIKGFEGGMSAKKYMAITDASKATATRDLQDLLEKNALQQIGSGRSVRYELNLDP